MIEEEKLNEEGVNIDEPVAPMPSRNDKQPENKKKNLLLNILPWAVIVIIILVIAIKEIFFAAPVNPISIGGNIDPQLGAINYWIISDPACNESACPKEKIIAGMKQIFPNGTAHDMDVFSSEGRNITRLFNVKRIPVVLFNQELSEQSIFKTNDNFRGVFLNASGYYLIPEEILGVNHFIDQVAEDQYYSLTRYVLNVQYYNMNKTPQIDFFVMSFCPYCNDLEIAMAPVYDLLKDKAIFYPRYLFYEGKPENSTTYCEQNGQYCSLHGVQELHQGVRELCAYYTTGPKAWFVFANAIDVKCNANNVDTCWEEVAKNINLNATAVQQCYDKESVKIMHDEQTVSNGALGITGTPTIYINGKPYNSGRTSKDLLNAMCSEYSPEYRPSACDTVLK